MQGAHEDLSPGVGIIKMGVGGRFGRACTPTFTGAAFTAEGWQHPSGEPMAKGRPSHSGT